jgi:hypothetical protein
MDAEGSAALARAFGEAAHFGALVWLGVDEKTGVCARPDDLDHALGQTPRAVSGLWPPPARCESVGVRDAQRAGVV